MVSRLIDSQRKKIAVIFASLGLFCLILITINYLMIGSYDKYIIRAVKPNDFRVAIVLGGGILSGQPRPLLQDRLDVAAKLLQEGRVDKLLLSGDNRQVDYNEPQAMRDYLVNNKHITAKQLQLDNAGRSTYETCERAKKVFGLDKALLISESTHLPRAIYLCRSFNLEAYGYPSDDQSLAGLKLGQRWREVLARTKAGINVHFIGERTVLGDKIRL